MSQTEQLPISLADIHQAAAALHGVANRTPVVTSRTFDRLTGRQVFFKCENFQRGGAFKFRGAYNCLSQLSAEERRRGIMAFSSGNHAQGVALAAQLQGIRATIVMPSDAPKVKLDATRGYGAEVVLIDRLKDDREAVTRRIAEERRLTIVPPFNDPRIMAGQGTAALELLQEVPDLDALVTPVGGGGLLSGCAVAARALRPEIAIYGVEAEGADDVRRSLQEDRIISIPTPNTIADGIRTLAPGSLPFAVMRRLVAEVVLVSDEEIIDALRFLLQRMKLVVEPTGAVAAAAVLQGRIPRDAQRVGVVISGGNVDPALLAQLLEG